MSWNSLQLPKSALGGSRNGCFELLLTHYSSANFKHSASLFDGFEKYDKQSPAIRLSEEGRMALAQVINELR